MAYTNGPIANPYLRLSFYLYCTIHKTTPREREKKSNKLYYYDVYEINKETEVERIVAKVPQNKLANRMRLYSILIFELESKSEKPFQYEFDLISMEKSNSSCVYLTIFHFELIFVHACIQRSMCGL